MMLLLSAPPLGGSIVAMVGPPLWRGRRRRRGRVEEASCLLLLMAKESSVWDDTASLNVLENWTLVLRSNLEGGFRQPSSSNVKFEWYSQCYILPNICLISPQYSDDIYMQTSVTMKLKLLYQLYYILTDCVSSIQMFISINAML